MRDEPESWVSEMGRCLHMGRRWAQAFKLGRSSGPPGLCTHSSRNEALEDAEGGEPRSATGQV